ncbi:MAG: VCBS repeat-containing protein [Planctomycetota bacterium]
MPAISPVVRWGLLTTCALSAATAVAQIRLDPLFKQHLPPDVWNTQEIACGDVDGDGDIDLIVANYRQQNQLYVNDGTGAFTDVTAEQMPADADRTQAVALCDVDGDGDLDLITGNGHPVFGEQPRLALNNGTGAFVDVTATQMPVLSLYVETLECGDLDGDGDLDLALGSSFGIRLLINNGTGVFSTGTAVPVGYTGITKALSLFDADRDGDLDLVTGNTPLYGNPGQNELFLNDGTGRFANVTATHMPASNIDTAAVAVGDVDGDGDPDLVFGNVWAGNQLYLNDGTGVFTDVSSTQLPAGAATTYGLDFGDVDGDGDVDLLLGINGQSQLYTNNGQGTFVDATAARMPIDVETTSSVRLADLDGDGDLDAVFGSGPDVAVWNPSNHRNRIHLNDGAGTFRAATGSSLATENTAANTVAVHDFDRDGDLDLFFGNEPFTGVPGHNQLFLNDGFGGFADATSTLLPLDADPTEDVAVADFDGDGHADLALANRGTQNRLYLNSGGGAFTDATAGRVPLDTDGSFAVVAGDVDGDGDVDLVFGNWAALGQQNRLYLNDGSGRFVDATAARLPQRSDATLGLALADVDGDGDLDLLVGNRAISGRLTQDRLHLNDGTGTFIDATAERLPLIATHSFGVLTGDVDADGDVDLVWTNSSNRLHLNDGTGGFVDVAASHWPTGGGGSEDGALVDVDGDGDLDFCGVGPGQDDLYLNDGSGRFVDATTPGLRVENTRTSAVAVGDVDGDGDDDLVLANDGSNHIYANLLGHVDVPLLVVLGRQFRLDAYAATSATSVSIALPFLSPDSARVPVPALGVFGLDPTQLITLPALPIESPPGRASISLMMPNAPSLVGTTLHAQALLSRGATLTLTNVARERILP